MKVLFFGLILLASVVSANEEQIGEVLGEVIFDEVGVTVTVLSGGCTYKEDFEVVVNKNVDAPTEIFIARIRRDFCKRAPFPKEIQFSYGELGVDEDDDFEVVNPVFEAVNYRL